jgi:hypothetical protein
MLKHFTVIIQLQLIVNTPLSTFYCPETGQLNHDQFEFSCSEELYTNINEACLTTIMSLQLHTTTGKATILSHGNTILLNKRVYIYIYIHLYLILLN